MAISDVLSSMATNISAAYDAAFSKGAVLPSQKNLYNLASTIAGAEGHDLEDAYLTTKNLPTELTLGVAKIRPYAFYSCTQLSAATFPVCSYIGSYAFAYCENMSFASFPKCINIQNSAFYGCYSMTAIYLAGNSVCSLAASGAFSYTQIYGTGQGSIYVPASLVSAYKSAAN